MNKVTTINLNGSAFQLEESGYEALRAYLDEAAAKLGGNPDREEIVSDIEQAIADKFRVLLGPYKTVVTTAQVEAAIAEMGPIDSGGDDEADAGTGSGKTRADSTGGPAGSAIPNAPKRLYRLYDGAIVSGVCNGIAAYFNVDANVVRLIFVVLAFVTGGAMVLAYIVGVFAIPVARTSDDIKAARGETFTAQEFIRRAKRGYYEGMKSFSDREARRAWKRKFRHDMRAWRHSFEGEMHAGVQNYQQQWQRYWTQHPGFGPAGGFTLPLLSALQGVLTLGCLIALVSLVTNGKIYGVPLPAEVPLWFGTVLLLVVYSVVTFPLKTLRHLFRSQMAYGPHSGASGFIFLADSIVWLAFAVMLLWLGFHHLPQVMEAFHSIPVLFHDAVSAVQRWWAHR